MTNAITIRSSTVADAAALARLAQLDSSRAPLGPALLAHAGGELRAAVGIADGHAVADPFHPTADLVSLLRLSAAQEREARQAREAHAGRFWPAPALRAALRRT